MKKNLLLAFAILFSLSIKAQVFSENFDSGSDLATLGWTTIDNDGQTPTLAWSTTGWNNVDRGGATTPYGGPSGNFAAMSTSWYTPAGTSDDWLISPAITLPASPATLVWDAKAQDPLYQDGYELRISTTAGTTIADFPTVLFSVAAEAGNAGNVYVTHTIDLSAYAGQTITLAWVNNSTDKFVLIVDNILVTTCPPPTSLTTSAITTSGASLSWTGTAPSYNVEYGVTGFTVGSGTTVTTPTNSYTLTGIMSGTTYDYYVTSSCGGSPVGPYTFTTPCLSTTVPYLQDFESATPPNMPNCTSIENAGIGNNWVTVNAPGNGFTSNTLEYAYNFTNDANAWFYTQGISLTAGTSYDISYKYGNNYTFYVESMKVAYGSSPTSSAMTNILADQPNISSATLSTNTVTFSPATSGVYYFGFNAYSIANQYNLYVDDISIVVTPTCVVPTGLLVSAPTTTSDTINWTASTSAPANGYEYYVSTSSTNPTATTVATGSVAAGITTASLTGLTPSTIYYVWVRSVCSSSDSSAWTDPASFTTLCVPVTAFPWTENFDSMTTLGAGIVPTCWTNVTGTNPWYSGDDTFTGFNLSYSEPNYMTIGYGNTTASDLWTPGFTLTGGQSYDFSFYYNTNGTTSSYIGFTGSVLVNSTADASGSTNLGSFITDTQGTTAYTLYTVSFVPATTGTYYFGLDVSSTFAPWYLGVDDFRLDTTLATTSFNNADFKVYPNPVKDILNLTYTKSISDVKVYNLIGQQVIAKSINANQSQIDMSNLATGTYMVKVTSDNEVKTIKVIKE